MSVTPSQRRDQATHSHVWKSVGIVTERDVILDGRTERPVLRKLLVRSCPCGAIRRTEVGRV